MGRQPYDSAREFLIEHVTPLTLIDTGFDVREDTPKGRDPDAYSPTLRRFHQQLWSKRLPSGRVFDLDANTPRVYLHHHSSLGEFFLSSDSVIPSFRKDPRLTDVFACLPMAEREAFLRLTYTIGGMMLFPSNQVDRKMTINGARGCHPKIKDRFDLTVECIRLHYGRQPSPLRAVLERYAAFFQLFDSFAGYIDFFLLQDLVTPDCSTVRFFTPFNDFAGSPVPLGLDAYAAYCDHAKAFLIARNARILNWCAARA